jgi:DNA-binding transcriptional LysR family regulator
MQRLDAHGFDWVLLRTFLAIYRAGSVAAAARLLGQLQPTLSRQLQQLEGQLGVRLFERAGRGLQATEAAAQVASSAAQMESIANRLSLALTAQAKSLEGSVRVAATQLIASNLLPSLLAELTELHPRLQVEVAASDALPNLLEHEADILISVARPSQLDVIVRRLGSTAVVVAAHADYLAAHGRPQQPDELLAHRLLGLDRSDTMLRGLQALGLAITREHFCFRSDDKATYLRALEAGLGIGFLADFLLDGRPQLNRVLPGLALPVLPVWISVHSEVASNALIRLVFDTLGQAISARLGRSTEARAS